MPFNSLAPPATNSKDASSTACCPVFHAGLKRTTDNRWVHLACCVWQTQVQVEDVSSIPIVDVSKVPDAAQSPPPSGDKDVISVPPKHCAICQQSWGFLVGCDHEGCEAVYHPLCAWFEGYLMSAAVMDNGYRRPDSTFPWGMRFRSYCLDHVPSAYQSRDLALQKTIRNR